MTDGNDGVVLWLPDGSSIEVPQDTIRRSAMLQEAIKTNDTASNVSITLPLPVLQDWLQSAEALKAAATATGHGVDIANHPRLLYFVRVRRFNPVGLEWFLVPARSCDWQHSLRALLQGQRVVTQQDAVFLTLHASVVGKHITVQML